MFNVMDAPDEVGQNALKDNQWYVRVYVCTCVRVYHYDHHHNLTTTSPCPHHALTIPSPCPNPRYMCFMCFVLVIFSYYLLMNTLICGVIKGTLGEGEAKG